MAKVLLVEDDEGVLEATTALLEMEGHEVVSESTGTGTVKAIKEKSPDILVIDLLLGDENGANIVKKIKEEDKSDIPVIILSAHPTAKEQAENAGANEFLAKPFEIDELLEKIDKHTN